MSNHRETNSKGRKVLAIILSITMLLAVLPEKTMTALAGTVPTVQSEAERCTTFTNPKVTDSYHMVFNSAWKVYLGQYPQNSSDANDLSPIMWYIASRGPVDTNENLDKFDFLDVSMGDFNLISVKVLDKCKYVNYGNLNKKALV